MRSSPVAVFPASRRERPKVAVLMNINARAVTPRIIRSIQQVVPPSDMYVSKSFEGAQRIVSDVLAKQYETVLIGGGDGTFIGFLGALKDAAGPQVGADGNTARALAPIHLPKLGVLKLGTGNSLATLCGASSMRGGGLLEDILQVRAGRVGGSKRLDLIDVEGISAPFAGFGYDAMVLNGYLRFKKLVASTPARVLGEGLPGYLCSLFLVSAPEALFKKIPRVEVRNVGAPARCLDSKGRPVGDPIPQGGLIYEGVAPFVSAGTCPCFGFNFRVFPFAGTEPGRMQLRVASTSVPKTIANLPAIWQGRWESPSFHDFFVEKVHIRFDAPMPLQIGGDAKGYRDELVMGVSDRPVRLLDFSRSAA